MKGEKRLRILVAEDHLIARVGIATILNAQPDMTVVAEAANGQQAVALYRSLRPDVALLDVRMPVLDGIGAVAAIRAEFPDARLICISTYSGDADIRRALAAGAAGLSDQGRAARRAAGAVRAVAQGERTCPRPVGGAGGADRHGPTLSAREVEVLELIVKGLANKQIAYVLDIAEHTVKNHVKSILDKLEVHDRTQAATAAIQRGIVHLP